MAMSEQAKVKAVRTEPNPALGLLALETFRRDLPRLLKERPGQWVAYHGDRLIGFGATPPDVYDELERRGLKAIGQEYIIRCIEPEPPDIVDSPYPFD